ncbi:MAG: hypothetical protein Q7R87_00565, partial [Nanoarchaeota archaeon]|nr:hypothetical protein [Nanoarchaeota archaeon]
MKSILEGKDWQHYIERKNPLYIFILSTISHGPMMDKITGAGFRDAIFTYSNGMGIMYHTKKEQEDIQSYFMKLIKSHSPKLGEWYNKAIKKNRESDKLSKAYIKNKYEINKVNYDSFYNHLIETFNYGTVIPYYVLAGINNLIENKGPIKDYEKTLHRFEELRGESKYPLLLTTVLSSYFKKASELLKLEDNSLAECLTPSELGEVLGGKLKIKR